MIKYKTKNNLLSIDLHFKSVSILNVPYDYDLSMELCKNGCKNFGKKYSCPPHSPSFAKLKYANNYLSVFVIKVYTSELKENYLTLKMINSVARSVQNSFFTFIKSVNTRIQNSYILLGNGSCRSCKSCSLIISKKCKKPHKLIYSLESTGINVDKLIRDNFDFKLKWFKISKDFSFPEYQCIVGGILCNDPSLFENYFYNWFEFILIKNEKVEVRENMNILNFRREKLKSLIESI